VEMVQGERDVDLADEAKPAKGSKKA